MSSDSPSQPASPRRQIQFRLLPEEKPQTTPPSTPQPTSSAHNGALQKLIAVVLVVVVGGVLLFAVRKRLASRLPAQLQHGGQNQTVAPSRDLDTPAQPRQGNDFGQVPPRGDERQIAHQEERDTDQPQRGDRQRTVSVEGDDTNKAVQASPAEIQALYDGELAAYRQRNFLDLEQYTDDLNARFKSEVSAEQAKYPSMASARQEAEQVEMARRGKLHDEVVARYSGDALTAVLTKMTRTGAVHPRLGDFAVIQHETPQVDWSNWEQPPRDIIANVLEKAQEDTAAAVAKRLDSDAALQKIEADIQRKYKMLKEGSTISMTLVGGAPSNRTINRMKLTKILSDSIILNNGMRKIHREDIALEDQARLFRDVHDKQIQSELARERQRFLNRAEQLTREELAQGIRAVLLENGYLPNPMEKVPSRYYEETNHIPQCWIAMNQFANIAREELIRQDMAQEEIIQQYMADQGYFKFHDADDDSSYWLPQSIKPMLDFCTNARTRLKDQLDEIRQRLADGKIALATTTSEGTVKWQDASAAAQQEKLYMEQFMRGKGFEPEDYVRDTTFWEDRLEADEGTDDE